MAGATHPLPRRVSVTTAAPLALDIERPEYHRASLSTSADGDGLVAHSTGRQISSRLAS